MAANLIDDSQLEKTREMTAKRREVVADGGSGPAPRIDRHPIIVERGEGAYFFDVDGNAYVDWWVGHGSMVFGHRPKPILDSITAQITQGGMLYALPHELDYEVGRKIVRAVPGIERLRFTGSRSEATQVAVRLARARTGKDKVMKWEGGYHGFLDCHAWSHVPAAGAWGTEGFPRALPSGAGIPKVVEETVVVAPFNDIDAVEVLVKRHRNMLACVLAEPVLSGAGVIAPAPGFLENLRRICDENDVVLIFDETTTGFRVSLGGAQELYGITPDLTCVGAAVGAGTPGAAAVGGKKELMELEPDGAVLPAGAYPGNPLTLAGMNAALDILINDRERVYGHLNAIADAMVAGMRGIFSENGVPAHVGHVGPMWQVYFGHEEPVTGYRQARAGDAAFFAQFQAECRARGVYLHPSDHERLFASTAHTKTEVDRSLEVIAAATRATKDRLGGPSVCGD